MNENWIYKNKWDVCKVHIRGFHNWLRFCLEKGVILNAFGLRRLVTSQRFLPTNLLTGIFNVLKYPIRRSGKRHFGLAREL